MPENTTLRSIIYLFGGLKYSLYAFINLVPTVWVSVLYSSCHLLLPLNTTFYYLTFLSHLLLHTNSSSKRYPVVKNNGRYTLSQPHFLLFTNEFQETKINYSHYISHIDMRAFSKQFPRLPAYTRLRFKLKFPEKLFNGLKGPF